MSVTAVRRATALITLILVMNTQARACGDIGIVSRDARFLVLDGDTLEINDVGSLWWLGIGVIDGFMPGSTLALALASIERVLDTRTGTIRDDAYGKQGAYFLLDNLGRDRPSLSKVPQMLRDESIFDTRLLTGDGETYVGVRSRGANGWTISLLDQSLGISGTWRSPEPSVGTTAWCVDASGRIILGGLDNRVVLAQDELTIAEVERADRSAGYQVSRVSIGCKALMGKLNASDPSLLDAAIVDLERNELVSEYSSPVSRGPKLLFDNATRLIEQEVVATEIYPNAFRLQPTNTFRVVDTSNGRTIIERTLDITPGSLYEQLLCQGGNEQVAIQSADEIHLLDLDTLSITATQQVPFDRYFVLGSVPETLPSPASDTTPGR